MQDQFVFSDEREKERLSVQSALLWEYEKPVFAHFFDKGSELSVLDIGCNNGSKTVKAFSSCSVSKVIGLEYDKGLADDAQKRYGNERFAFYQADVESSDIDEKMERFMTEHGVKSFDLIYLSFVLMHLKDAEKVLCSLARLLSPNGRLIIAEANDKASYILPDEAGMLGGFLEILKKDKYSGNRELGAELSDMLVSCGYDDITVWSEEIFADKTNKEKKRAIFETFFSYLPEDVSLLLAEEADNAEYIAWYKWLEENFEKLKKLILSENTDISMGIKILSCKRGAI